MDLLDVREDPLGTLTPTRRKRILRTQFNRIGILIAGIAASLALVTPAWATSDKPGEFCAKTQHGHTMIYHGKTYVCSQDAPPHANIWRWHDKPEPTPVDSKPPVVVPTPTAVPGQMSTLPKTGAPTWLYATGGTMLAAGGAALVVMGRRRRFRIEN
jgi:LPXTG-motif cell wall-anchored protein